MKRLFAAALLLTLTSAAQAQEAVALGKAEAVAHCARCHPALGTGRPTSTEARRFRPLTRAPDDASAQGQLVALLAEGHAGLSSDTFSQAELGTLAAYLRSLKW
jgi:mono/diheme cytochrome c family protein